MSWHDADLIVIAVGYFAIGFGLAWQIRDHLQARAKRRQQDVASEVGWQRRRR